MQCEVCGRKIFGKPHQALIEGAELTVCNECLKHGKIIEEEPKPAKPKPTRGMKPISLPSAKTQRRETPPTTQKGPSELVDNFYVKIRHAREKMGLSHEALGKKINEKVSLLKKVETGKMLPDDMLATRLEHALKVKLLVPPSEDKIPKTKIAKPSTRELTLGDLIKLDKDKTEENS